MVGQYVVCVCARFHLPRIKFDGALPLTTLYTDVQQIVTFNKNITECFYDMNRKQMGHNL
jgi:hypothetical protein